MDCGWNRDAEVLRATEMSRRSVLVGIGGGAASTVLTSLEPLAPTAAAQEATAGTSSKAFLVIRRYQLAPDASLAEVVRRTEEGFLPILGQLNGFVEYYSVDLGSGHGATISVFSNQAGAEESSSLAATWVQENVAELIEGSPEIMQGPVLLKVMADRIANAAVRRTKTSSTTSWPRSTRAISRLSIGSWRLTLSTTPPSRGCNPIARV